MTGINSLSLVARVSCLRVRLVHLDAPVPGRRTMRLRSVETGREMLEGVDGSTNV